MENYIIFLRGINVSGKNILKMDALKSALHNNSITNAKTYIQSGNILIPNSNLSASQLKESIETLLEREFDIRTECYIKTDIELVQILDNIPYSLENTKQLYFTFVNKQPNEKTVDTILNQDFNGDMISITENCIYIHCANGYGKTKLNNNFLEKKLETIATTRNYNTILKMIALSRAEK